MNIYGLYDMLMAHCASSLLRRDTTNVALKRGARGMSLTREQPFGELQKGGYPVPAASWGAHISWSISWPSAPQRRARSPCRGAGSCRTSEPAPTLRHPTAASAQPQTSRCRSRSSWEEKGWKGQGRGIYPRRALIFPRVGLKRTTHLHFFSSSTGLRISSI